MSTMFELVGGGIGRMPDPKDNSDNHVAMHHETGTGISFNADDAGAGIDDILVNQWESRHLDPE